MKKQSLTITGLAILVIGMILDRVGIPLAEGSLETTITTLIQVIGGLSAYWGRMRQGDVNALGQKTADGI